MTPAHRPATRAIGAMLTLLLLTALAACGGSTPGSTAPVPGAAGTGSTAPASALTYALSGAAATFTLPAAGAYGGTVSFPPFAAPAGARIVAASSTDAAALFAQGTVRRPAETGTTTVLFYVLFTPTATITLPSTPGFTITIPRALARQNPSIFYAISAPAASGAIAGFRTEGPATLSETKATFAPTNIPLTLHERTPYLFAFYAQTRLATGPFLYVADRANNAIDAFPLGDSGDVAPLFAIAGSATLLDAPVSLARDRAGNLYVGNSAGTITVYGRGARGDATPIRTIGGPATGLTGRLTIAVGENGEIYAAQLGQRRFDGSVRVFAREARGDTPPSRIITTVRGPSGIAVDARGEIFVADVFSPTIDVFDESANGAATPIRQISLGRNPASGLAVDDANAQLFVASGAVISVYRLVADGSVLPDAQLGGFETGLTAPFALALTGDTIVASDVLTLRTYARSPLGDAAPLRVIAGPLTTLGSADGITILPR